MWACGIVEEEREDMQYGITATTWNIKLSIRQRDRTQINEKNTYVLGCQEIHPFGYLVGEAKKILSVQSHAIFLQNLTNSIWTVVWIT